jgi:hypothetical protein
MAYDVLQTREIARQVRKRKALLRMAVACVDYFVEKYGIVVEKAQGSSNTHIVSRLINFKDFTFETDYGQTMFGGNNVKIWHHPGKRFREGGLDSAHDSCWNPVIDVYFQVGNDWQVNVFNPTPVWQKELIHLFRNRVRVCNEINRVRKSILPQKTSSKQEQAIKVREDLIAEALKLRIS